VRARKFWPRVRRACAVLFRTKQPMGKPTVHVETTIPNFYYEERRTYANPTSVSS
jgi:hypothetical protein